MSPLFRTAVAHTFLSCIVTHVEPLLLKEISHSVASQNIPPASMLVPYNFVQEDVGVTGVSLNARIVNAFVRTIELSVALMEYDKKYSQYAWFVAYADAAQ